MSYILFTRHNLRFLLKQNCFFSVDGVLSQISLFLADGERDAVDLYPSLFCLEMTGIE